MARKVSKKFSADLRKNTVKGGAWLVKLKLEEVQDAENVLIKEEVSAWTSAANAKRYTKEKVREWTPRKSVSLLGGNVDDKNKPTYFSGSLTYKESLS